MSRMHAEIESLKKQVERMKKMKIGKGKKKERGTRRPEQGRKRKGGKRGAAQRGGEVPPAGAGPGGDPVLQSLQGKLDPFNAIKGTVGVLGGGPPNQRFMAKANTSVSVPAGCTMYFMQAPCAANDANFASLVIAVQSVSGVPITGNWNNATVGDQVVTGGTITRLATSTPYPASTINDGYNWVCTGTGLKFTYEGTELNRSGTFRYCHDDEYKYNGTNTAWSGIGPVGIQTFLDGFQNTIRQSINEVGVVEINAYDPNEVSQTGTNYWPGKSSNNAGTVVGGTTATTFFALRPYVLGTYINSSTGTISFHIEMVEHWAMHSSKIASLHIADVAHIGLSAHIVSTLQNVRQAHAQTPNKHHLGVFKDIMKAERSPLGHSLLNGAMKAVLPI